MKWFRNTRPKTEASTVLWDELLAFPSFKSYQETWSSSSIREQRSNRPNEIEYLYWTQCLVRWTPTGTYWGAMGVLSREQALFTIIGGFIPTSGCLSSSWGKPTQCLALKNTTSTAELNMPII